MYKKLFPGILVFVVACASKSPKEADIKDQEIKTNHEKSEMISVGSIVGVNEEKEIVVQDKIQMTDHLRLLVTTIKHKQDELYGSKRFGTRGLYGKLERCVARANRQNKEQTIAVLAARDIVVPEQELGDLEAGRFGRDEKDNIVAVDEVKLRDKIKDLEGKKRKLYEKEEELLAEMGRCEARLNN